MNVDNLNIKPAIGLEPQVNSTVFYTAPKSFKLKSSENSSRKKSTALDLPPRPSTSQHKRPSSKRPFNPEVDEPEASHGNQYKMAKLNVLHHVQKGNWSLIKSPDGGVVQNFPCVRFDNEHYDLKCFVCRAKVRGDSCRFQGKLFPP